MNKKYFRGIFFFIIIIVIFGVLNYRYKRSAYYRQMDGLFRYENIPYDLEIINLGSSEEAMDIDWRMISGYNSFNFALHGQCINMDRLVLDSYKEHLGEGCVVIIPASYFTPYYNDDIMLNPGTYYRILDIEKIPECPEYSIENLILYRWFPLLSSGKELREAFSSMHYEELEYSEGGEQTGTEELMEEFSRKRGNEYYTYRIKPKVNPVCDMAYHSILQMCEENNWKPIIITCPLHESYDDCFPDDVKERFHSYIDALCIEYPDIIYLDYSKEEAFYRSFEHRHDGDHLDLSGRKIFTKMLYADLVKNKVIELKENK